ncbi:3-hydroxyacyl-ACP dehydratase FabZ [Pelagibacteraceae bacterium]|nr:3-hydroxyacyl-ACP dehydratase FabZ [Pelagibacteraceae bacterium]
MPNEKLNVDEIRKLIPHREPFLFLDELINIQKLSKATGIKTYSNNENFFKGHFPGQPVVPGVILVEMMAQTAAALIAYSIREETFDKIVYLMNIENTKFRKPVFPNTKIFTDVNAVRSKGRVWRFEGKSYDINDNAICEAKWSAMIMDRNSEQNS